MTQTIKKPLYYFAVLLIASLAFGTATSIWPEIAIIFFIFFLLIALAWLSYIVFTVIQSVRMQNIRLGIMLSLLLTFVASFSFSIMRISSTCGEYMHLALFYPYYSRVVADTKTSHDHITFDWGTSGGFGNADSFRELYYDEDDELSKYIGTKKSEEPIVEWQDTRHLIGHFYLITTGWQ